MNIGILDLLNLVIGLTFIFFILSLVASAVQEVRATTRKLRAKNLEAWIKDTLDSKNKSGESLGELIIDHKLISGLVKKGRKPAYIPSEHFVAAFLETVSKDQNGLKAYNINSIETAVTNTKLLPDDLKQSILQSISEASGKLENLKKDLSNWFDNAMERIAGTYKNQQRNWLIGISFVLAIIFNADAIMLSKYLYENKAVRERLVASAEEAINDEKLIPVNSCVLF